MKPTQMEFNNFVDEILGIFKLKANEYVKHCFQNEEATLCEAVRDSITGYSKNKFSLRKLPILPDNTKFHFSYGDSDIFVIEQKPTLRTVSYMGDLYDWNSSRESHPHILYNQFYRGRIALPYVIFIICIQSNTKNVKNFRIFYRNKPLGNISDDLYRCNLPNIKSDTPDEICLGDMKYGGDNITQIVNSLITSYWASNFNTDLVELFRDMGRKDHRLAGFKAWISYSKENPLFPLSVKWDKHSQLWTTINGIMGRCVVDVPPVQFANAAKKCVNDAIKDFSLSHVEVDKNQVANRLYDLFIGFYSNFIKDKQTHDGSEDMLINRNKLVEMAEELIKYKIDKYRTPKW